MSSIFDILKEHLDNNAVEQIGVEAGTNEKETRSAIEATLPSILEGLARKAQKDSAGTAVNDAVEQESEGGLLDQLNDFIKKKEYEQPRGNYKRGGYDAVEDVMDGKHERAAEGVGAAAGIDVQKALKIMAMVAPVVLAVMARMKKSKQMAPTEVNDWVQQERKSAEQTSPDGMGIIKSMLDQDGDGDFDMMDMAKLAMSGKLGALMGKK